MFVSCFVFSRVICGKPTAAGLLRRNYASFPANETTFRLFIIKRSDLHYYQLLFRLDAKKLLFATAHIVSQITVTYTSYALLSVWGKSTFEQYYATPALSASALSGLCFCNFCGIWRYGQYWKNQVQFVRVDEIMAIFYVPGNARYAFRRQYSLSTEMGHTSYTVGIYIQGRALIFNLPGTLRSPVATVHFSLCVAVTHNVPKDKSGSMCSLHPTPLR